MEITVGVNSEQCLMCHSARETLVEASDWRRFASRS